MKRFVVIAVLSAFLVAGGVLTFSGISRAADTAAAAAAAPATWMGRGSSFMDTVASVVGLDRNTVMTRRHNGESLAAIAASQGIEEQKLIDALKAEHTVTVSQLVAAGRLTQAQADAYTASFNDAVKANVELTTTGANGGYCFGASNGIGGAAAGTGTGGFGRGMGRGRGCGGPR